MTTIGIIGEVGSYVARAAIASGYHIVIANARGPETLKSLVEGLGPSARAATAANAAAAGEFVVVAVPLKLVNDMPAAELAGNVVIDTNNYMAWRDGHYPVVERGEKTEHELRQEQIPHLIPNRTFVQEAGSSGSGRLTGHRSRASAREKERAKRAGQLSVGAARASARPERACR